MADIGTAIEAKGWRQGCLLRVDDWSILAVEQGLEADERQKAVIVSQSCDLTNDDLNAEPYAEVIVGDLADVLIKDLMYGKHPRSLYLPVQCQEGDGLTLALRPWKRFQIPRGRLADFDPDPDNFLLRDDLQVLITWLAQRYVRGALPDSFNGLIAKKRKRWEKLRRNLSSHVSELLVELHPAGELEAGQQYSVNLLALVPVDQRAMLEEAQQEILQLAGLMESLGMEVQASAKTEDSIPYSVVRRMTRFPLEYLSLRGKPFDPLPAELDPDAG